MRNDLNQHEEVSSTASRVQHGDSSEVHFLLSTQDSSQTTGQYCYPSGACNLGNLDDGASGFVLQGQAVNDYNGYSVSSAGDINGDGLADILVGAPTASPNNQTYAGKTYVIFGSNQTNAWGSGTVNLTNLVDGQRGFVLQGMAGDRSGYSVSSAGDINGDGLADILVGAPAYPTAGKTYVVFGTKQANAWGSGTVNLTSLINGQQGFVLQGEATGDFSGCSVSGAGDINGDGLADILVGADEASPSGLTRAGKTYVIFGTKQPNAWGFGTVNLTSLINGQRGFVLQGQALYEFSGYSVSGAGDINGDGLADILVGAPYADTSSSEQTYNQGKTYGVFGSNLTNAWGSGTLNLTSLINGQRGFVLLGQLNYEQSGSSVSSVGDINGDDLTDILIGAPYASPSGMTYAGRTYAVFGSNQTNAWGSGTVNLTSLINGQRGFVLQGQAAYDYGGVSVSNAGDINGDGLADIIVGAYGGETYVVFGSDQPDAWESGTVNLTNLINGQRGFVLLGAAYSYKNSMSVCSAGDINGDGLAEVLVGTPYALSSAGETYVVFSDTIPPILINNSLSIYSSEAVLLTPAFLAAMNQNYDDSSLMFVPTAVLHGQFEATSNPGILLTDFTQQQIWQGNIQFAHDGSNQAPSYNISVGSGIIYTNPQPANITFMAFGILNNVLTINQGQAVSLTTNNLYATGGDDASLQFTISNLQHGQFALSSAPSKGILTFSQQNIVSNQILFTQDNSVIAPVYTVVVTNGQLISSPSNATIYFDTLPILVTNQLFLPQSQSAILNANNLLATHNGEEDLNLQFIIANVQHGYFEQVNQSGIAITEFLQQDIVNQQIAFVPDDSLLAPSYQVQVTDGIADSAFSSSMTLLVTRNDFPINQGETLLLNTSNLNINSNQLSSNQIYWNIASVNYGKFALKNNPNSAIYNFTQQQVNTQSIVFISDGSINVPSCNWTVLDNQNQTYGSLSANITFNVLTLINNSLAINQGETINFTTTNLYASGGSNANLKFIISNLLHGEFALSSAPSQAIFSFSQQNIIDNQVMFTHDNSLSPPAYTVVLSNGQVTTTPSVAAVSFGTVPILENNQLFLPKNQSVVLSTNNLLATDNGQASQNLQFNLYNVQHGHFERLTQPGINVTEFLQQDISNSQIGFVPDNSVFAPDYQVQATDGVTYSTVSISTTFLVNQNYLPVNQGESLPLNANYINISSNRLSANQIYWDVSSVQYGQFVLQSNPNFAANSFSQQQINQGSIVFIPDGSTNSPSCGLILTDDQNHFYGSLAANVDFDTAPQLINNQLTTFPGEKTILSAAYLYAEDVETDIEALQFFVSNAEHGYFAYFNQQSQPIDQFYQKNISNGKIVFITDVSGSAPAYQISVYDGRMNCTGCPQAVKMTFDPKGSNHSSGFSWSNTITAAVAAGGIGLLVTLAGLYIKYKLVPTYFEKTQTQGTERERTYRQNVILPIAKHIYNRVKFSGFLGYASQSSIKDYVDAVSELVRQLEGLGVGVDLEEMSPSARSRLLESIAIQVQKTLVEEKRCCSFKNMKNVVSADTTSALLRASSATIAQAIRDDMHSLEISAGGEEDGKGKTSPGFLSSILTSSGPAVFSTKRPSEKNQAGFPLLRSQSDSGLN